MAGRRAQLLDDLTVGRDGAAPLQRQLYDGLRLRMLDGRLRPGLALPSSRALALQLDIGRNTVVAALDQLVAEGYLQSRPGAGMFVAESPPDLPTVGTMRAQTTPDAPRRLSARAGRIDLAERGPDTAAPHWLTPGLAAIDAFPDGVWRRLSARVWRQYRRRLLAPCDPCGWPELRAAIADYLGPARGLTCRADDIVILASARQATDLCARLLTDPGEAVLFEEPGYLGARGALTQAGLRLVPVAVDGQGMDVDAGLAAAPDARIAYVTPTHQYPLGGTLGLKRRLALIDWARRHGGWIIEDDYDGEFALRGPAITALAGLDRHARTIYIGTFSKSLYMGLRLAYMVVPPDLTDHFRAARVLQDGHPPTWPQAVTAAFVAEGHFAAHIRRMRKLYAERQDALTAAVTRHLGNRLALQPADAGQHLTGLFADAVDDRALAARLRADGVFAGALSRFYIGERPRSGLVMGFAGTPAADIDRAVARIAVALTALP